MNNPTPLAPEPALVNRVANSALITLNLEDYRPKGERVLLDIQAQLFQGLILREKDFREWAKTHPWANYAGKFVAVTCGTDAIVPDWAYMLLATLLQPHAAYITFGTLAQLEDELMLNALQQEDWSRFAGEKIVIKGCGGISTHTYTAATRLLMPHATKLMYGEPCSMVPLWRK
jgi:hypothetical protein